MPVEGISAAFRDLSVRPGSGEDRREEGMAKAKPKDVKRRKVRQKRVHLFRNPYVCDQCFKWWREADALIWSRMAAFAVICSVQAELI